METRTLRNTDLHASVVGLGCNNFGREGTLTATQEGTTAVVTAALDAGVNLFDTADIYGGYGESETLLGVALAGRRGEALVATKCGHDQAPTPLDDLGPKGSRAYIRASVEGSLSRLQIDTIDLFQMHRPDPSTPIEETLTALSELAHEGKIRAYGHSGYSAAQIEESEAAAAALGVAPFVTSQDELSLIARGVELDGRLETAERHGLGFLPYFPLANGLFTGKFTRTERPADSRISRVRPQIAEGADWDAMETFEAFARERGITMLEATMGWFLSRPAVSSVIAGATKPEQVTQNAASAGWRPSADDVAQIEALFPAKPGATL